MKKWKKGNTKEVESYDSNGKVRMQFQYGKKNYWEFIY